MSIKLFNNPLLEKALDATWAKNEVISNNIANIDTPGYKRQDINFQEYLNAAMKKDAIAGIVTDPKHIPINSNNSGVKIKVTNDNNATSMRLDGNNVDIDSEMAELAKNQILYNSYTTLLNKHYNKLKTAIREGR